MPGDLTIIIGEERVTIQKTPISGDVAITPAGVSTIGSSKITVDMLAPGLLEPLLPFCEIDIGQIDYCKVQ